MCSGLPAPSSMSSSIEFFVGGEELQKRTHAEAEGQFFDGVIVAGKMPAVDEDVKAGVFALDDDVHGSRH